METSLWRESESECSLTHTHTLSHTTLIEQCAKILAVLNGGGHLRHR